MRRCAEAIARTVLAFLDAVILGCLRSCFGARRRRRSSGRRDELVRGDQAAAAEVSWDDEEGLVRDGRVHEELADGAGYVIDKELRREASYLKLCGTISETPAELRSEQSYKNNLENANECDNKLTSGPKADCKLLFQATSSEGCEERRSELNTEGAGHHHGVEFVPHSASSEKRLFQNIQHKALDSGGSPFPTPIVLRDDMQTPATAYASHRGTSISGKRVRTRKQFVYPVLRAIENRLGQTELTEYSSPLASFLKGRNLEAYSINDPTQTSSTSMVKSGLSETPSSYSALDSKGLNSDEKNIAMSLSHWVKSSSTAENQGPAGDQSHDDYSFVTEKPVFMASDLYFDTDNSTPWLPKAWDGNGIPNTTSRYKEDQKVKWHTTPFEERLLKVLSDEDHCPPRKVVRGKLLQLEEKAE